ncbi:hypothetical protein [Caballeronia sp. J97]|uniref:hypothetical protein n=1 Tax=Caballeronia sp. J97 TaxID=2805429 RepID=UPI002AB1A6B7|nr:hypothetical protein [Caballeronia sp. J97]
MFKTIRSPLPPDIDPEWIRQLQEQVARRRKIEAEIRRQMGKPEVDSRKFIQHLMNFPDIGMSLEDLLREADEGGKDVSR